MKTLYVKSWGFLTATEVGGCSDYGFIYMWHGEMSPRRTASSKGKGCDAFFIRKQNKRHIAKTESSTIVVLSQLSCFNKFKEAKSSLKI